MNPARTSVIEITHRVGSDAQASPKLFPVALCPYLTSLTPGATSMVIEGASHFPQVDQPAALVAELASFL